MPITKTSYLIIGGGIAGTSAAETIREHDSSGSITIVSDEPYPLYSRIILSKTNFFLEKIPLDSIWLKKEEWYKENNINLVLGKKAARLDPDKKEVALDDSSFINYEKLLLSVGGEAKKLDIPGADKIMYLRALDDARRIMEKSKSAKKAVIIGSGFISFEVGSLMREKNLDAIIIIRAGRYWESVLDEESSSIVEEALRKNGIKIVKNAQAKEIVKDGFQKLAVALSNGQGLECDIALAGLGIVFRLDWIKDAGINVNNGILANEYLETNVKDIWAAGDCAEFNDIILGKKVQYGNWVNAQIQGRTVGLNMVGRKEAFKLVSFYSTYGFGLSVAFVGDVKKTSECEKILHIDREKNECAQLIFKDKRIIGATLINRMRDLPKIKELIEKKADIDNVDNLWKK